MKGRDLLSYGLCACTVMRIGVQPLVLLDKEKKVVPRVIEQTGIGLCRPVLVAMSKRGPSGCVPLVLDGRSREPWKASSVRDIGETKRTGHLCVAISLRGVGLACG